MNKGFYERCKKVVSNLELTYEQGIARDVILNELDMLEKQAKDYQTRFNKAIEILKDTNIEMPTTLLIETIDYALKILEVNENK